MNELQEAIRVLKAGGVVVFPTETSYGIGCDATNAKAVRRVFRLKGRPHGKGTPLIVSSLAMARRYGVFSKTALALAKQHWPGALTLAVPVLGTSLSDVPNLIIQHKTIAMRVSSHPTARALARGLGRPLVATSANRSGEPPAFQITDLPHWKDVFILDAGRLSKAPPSTLVRVVGDTLEVLRPGSIKILRTGLQETRS